MQIAKTIISDIAVPSWLSHTWQITIAVCLGITAIAVALERLYKGFQFVGKVYTARKEPISRFAKRMRAVAGAVYPSIVTFFYAWTIPQAGAPMLRFTSWLLIWIVFLAQIVQYVARAIFDFAKLKRYIYARENRTASAEVRRIKAAGLTSDLDCHAKRMAAAKRMATLKTLLGFLPREFFYVHLALSLYLFSWIIALYQFVRR